MWAVYPKNWVKRAFIRQNKYLSGRKCGQTDITEGCWQRNFRQIWFSKFVKVSEALNAGMSTKQLKYTLGEKKTAKLRGLKNLGLVRKSCSSMKLEMKQASWSSRTTHLRWVNWYPWDFDNTRLTKVPGVEGFMTKFFRSVDKECPQDILNGPPFCLETTFQMFVAVAPIIQLWWFIEEIVCTVSKWKIKITIYWRMIWQVLSFAISTELLIWCPIKRGCGTKQRRTWNGPFQ